MLVTRRYRFCASHRLHSKELSEPANQELYGKCNNPYGHGHNYEVEVTVSGPVDRRTGRVVDLEELDHLVRRQVIDPFDHRNLNQEIADFRQLVPTTENLAAVIDKRLRHGWATAFHEPTPALEGVRIYETARNIFQT